MNFWPDFIKLKTSVGGNREQYGYEETFGQPREEQQHITVPARHNRRLLSQLEFAIRLNEENNAAFDSPIRTAMDFLNAAMETDGVLTRRVCEEAEALLKAVHPDWSIASWSIRFCLGLDGVITVLSGMSTLEQVKDNTTTSNEAQPLTEEDHKVLAEAMRIYRENAPIRQSEIDQYKGLMYHGVPVTAILQAYSICQIQPDPGFADDNNYLKNAIAEAEHVDFHGGLEKQTVITADGKDITEMVEKAVVWLTEHSF